MFKQLLPVGVTLLVLCSFSGCVALAMGDSEDRATPYSNGRAADNVNAPVDRVYAAALATLQSKKLPVNSKQANATAAHVGSTFSDNQEIRIDINAVTSSVSEIKIRVGSGDKNRSLDLLNGIKSRL